MHAWCTTDRGAGRAGQGQDREAHRDGRGGQGCVLHAVPFSLSRDLVCFTHFRRGMNNGPVLISLASTTNKTSVGVIKLDTNGAFTEVKIIAISDVGKQLQEE